MPETLTRRELYDLVWSTPMTKLAERFGMTSRGLAKVCGRHRVPVPARGHWARIEAGQTIQRPIFVQVDDPEVEPVPIGGSEARSRAVSRQNRQRSVSLAPAQPKHLVELQALRAEWAEEDRVAKLAAEARENRTFPQTVYVFAVEAWDWQFDLEQQGEASAASSNPHEVTVLPGYEGFVLTGALLRPASLRGRPVELRVEPTRPLRGIQFSDTTRAHVGSVTVADNRVLAEALVPDGVGSRLCILLTAGHAVQASFVTEPNEGAEPEPIIVGIGFSLKRVVARGDTAPTQRSDD